MRPVKWGIIGTARIAMESAVAGMAKSPLCEIAAIASRDQARAEQVAAKLGIPRAYGSYDDLLADPIIEAVYIPLPNHLHVPVAIKAAQAGKHVLCEKPLAMTAAEASSLLSVRDRTGVVIAEGIMSRYHPRWQRARELVRKGEIGELRAVQFNISGFSDDPALIKNQVETGGGALYTMGVYGVAFARYIFGGEPKRVSATIDRDPTFGVDRSTSVTLEFERGHANIFCSLQAMRYQWAHIFGTTGRIGLEQVVVGWPNRPSTLVIDLNKSGETTENFALVDQFQLQAEALARCIRDGVALEFPLEDSIRNMQAIDAVFASARDGRQVVVN